MSKQSLATYVYRVVLKERHIRALFNKLLLLLVVRKSVTIPEGVLYLNQRDVVISSALSLGIYEPYQLNVFRSLLKESMVVVDIGANIGLYTIIAAKAVRQVYAFEPEANNFALLNKNVAANKFSNVGAIQKGITDEDGTQEFYLSDNNKGAHSLFPPTDTFTKGSIETTSLDTWATVKGITQIDLIKIDAQGAEALVLKGMQQILKQKPILVIEYEPDMIALSGADPLTLLEDLRTLGYSFYEMREDTETTERVTDLAALRTRCANGEYTNLICRCES